jgi:hypothetical protein
VAGPFELAAVLASARRREGLEDLGPSGFEEPLGVLLDAYAAARLSGTGSRVLRGGVVHSLRTGSARRSGSAATRRSPTSRSRRRWSSSG